MKKLFSRYDCCFQLPSSASKTRLDYYFSVVKNSSLNIKMISEGSSKEALMNLQAKVIVLLHNGCMRQKGALG